jgi:hypothetical protein
MVTMARTARTFTRKQELMGSINVNLINVNDIVSDAVAQDGNGSTTKQNTHLRAFASRKRENGSYKKASSPSSKEQPSSPSITTSPHARWEQTNATGVDGLQVGRASITVPQYISAVKRRVSVDSSSQYQYQVGFQVLAIKKLRREITQKDQDITQLTQAKEAAIRRAEAAEKDAKEALLKLECSLCLEINEVQYVMCPCGHVICTDCNVRYSTYANCLTCSTFVENRIKLHK